MTDTQPNTVTETHILKLSLLIQICIYKYCIQISDSPPSPNMGNSYTCVNCSNCVIFLFTDTDALLCTSYSIFNLIGCANYNIMDTVIQE